jgi:hypothetical protein
MLLNEAPTTSHDIDAALDRAKRLRQLARSCRRTADETIRTSYELTERIRQQLEIFAQTTEDRTCASAGHRAPHGEQSPQFVQPTAAGRAALSRRTAHE